MKVHAKVRVANVSGIRTKKHQKKEEHKRKMMTAAAATLEEHRGALLPAPPVLLFNEVEMVDASKLQKREKAKIAKKERQASKMVLE